MNSEKEGCESDDDVDEITPEHSIDARSRGENMVWVESLRPLGILSSPSSSENSIFIEGGEEEEEDTHQIPRFAGFSAGTGDTNHQFDAVLVDFSDINGCDGSTGEAPTRIGVESAIEKVLLFALHPALNGIPNLRVPSAEDRARILLRAHDLEHSVQRVIEGSEGSLSQVLLHFFIEQIPFIGCPVVLLKHTWQEIRSIAVIAALYGHDVHTTRVHHEILSCLIPQEKIKTTEPLVAETARKVAKTMLKSAVKRVTGLATAASCVELCSQLYTVTRREDDYLHILDTPTHAAREYFRPKTIPSQYTFLLLFVASAGPTIFIYPMRFLLFLTAILSIVVTWKRSERMRCVVQSCPTWCWTAFVFGVHACYPLFSAHTAINMMIPFVEALFTGCPTRIFHSCSLLMLGLYNLSSVFIHHFDQLQPDERLRELFMVVRARCGIILNPLFCCTVGIAVYNAYVGPLLGTDRQFFARFLLSYISCCTQARLMEQMKNAREILFRLVGAEHIVASTLCYLLKGVAVARNSPDITSFLHKIAPPPVVCCCVMALRSMAIWYGIGFAICSPRLFTSPFLGFVFGSMASTALWGSFTTVVFMEWREKKDDIESPAGRLAYLIPGEVSSRALGYLTTALVSCQRQAAGFMVRGIIERVIAYFTRRVYSL